MEYVIYGTPITKKNSQQIITIKGRPCIIQSKAYRLYEKTAAAYLLKKPEQPIDYPICLKCLYYMPTRRRVDLNNLLAATCDILVKYQIIDDDNYKIVQSHDGSRVFYDKEYPRCEIYIERIESDV